MQLVTQLTPFTCGLACVESVCADFGVLKRQEDMLRDFRGELLKGIVKIEHFGCINPTLMTHILIQYGFSVQACRDHRPEIQQEIFEKVDPATTAIIISAHFKLNSHHSVRFGGMEDGDTLFAMNPTFNGAKIDKYSISKLITWDYEFLVIERKEGSNV